MSGHLVNDASVTAAEGQLRQVMGIESVAIDHANGNILAVHVLARADRKPKQVARDVVSMLRARMNVVLDHKKVSVVVMGSAAGDVTGRTRTPQATPTPTPPTPTPTPTPTEPESAANRRVFAVPNGEPESEPSADPTAEEAGPRVSVHAIAVRDMRDESEAEVVLRHGRREAMGISRGNGHGIHGARLVASATAHALERFLDSRHRIEVGEVKQIELGDRSAILVTVSVNAGRDEYVLLGSCWVFNDLRRATVYATLDATNRVIGRLERRQHVDYEVVPGGE